MTDEKESNMLFEGRKSLLMVSGSVKHMHTGSFQLHNACIDFECHVNMSRIRSQQLKWKTAKQQKILY